MCLEEGASQLAISNPQSSSLCIVKMSSEQFRAVLLHCLSPCALPKIPSPSELYVSASSLLSYASLSPSQQGQKCAAKIASHLDCTMGKHRREEGITTKITLCSAPQCTLQPQRILHILQSSTCALNNKFYSLLFLLIIRAILAIVLCTSLLTVLSLTSSRS